MHVNNTNYISGRMQKMYLSSITTQHLDGIENVKFETCRRLIEEQLKIIKPYMSLNNTTALSNLNFSWSPSTMGVDLLAKQGIQHRPIQDAWQSVGLETK